MKNLITSLLREGLLDEDYPESFSMEEFKQLTSYRTRIEYCKQHLTRIGAGSSRIVYQIDNDKVLKLAKNRKGLAQNEAEASIFNSGWHDDICAKVIDYHQDNFWVEMELAKPVKESDFPTIIGVSLEDIHHWLDNHYKLANGRKPQFRFEEEHSEKLANLEFIWDMQQIMDNWDVPAGDFGRTSTYGKVLRDGNINIVVVDYGLTTDVASTYYSMS